ncbi:MAG: hypothetical protein JXA19_00545 [Anaerolineales bacterium]|nr:hypothetical protein [Anaerolineales bacterium]
MNNKFQSLIIKPRPYVMAHRGNKDLFPENTIPAFQRAIDEGVDIIETDLQITKDGEFVCIHDESVDRTTNGSGLVSDFTLDELKDLDASYNFPDHKGVKIPRLSELCDIVPSDIWLALELKSDEFLKPEICQKLLDELNTRNVLEKTIFLSFSEGRLGMIKHVDPNTITGWITMSSFFPQQKGDMMGVFWPFVFLNPFHIWMAKQKGMLYCPLDDRPDRRLWYYKWMKVDAILSNNPGKTIQKLKKAKSH